ncbi:hypothetical protein Baya_10195 [Bagarius yarrelli]|uniref:Uncharacterized protein n=1 Tax=Bagarius yarrelli TaxID=175774 RepID=A0A556UFB8_BAGYA|nr:hypothetical protein Baya_10195 [Bagarius yarrelli]
MTDAGAEHVNTDKDEGEDNRALSIKRIRMELDRASAAAAEQAGCVVSQYERRRGNNASVSSSSSRYLSLGHSGLVRSSVTLTNSTCCHKPSQPYGKNWNCTATQEETRPQAGD